MKSVFDHFVGLTLKGLILESIGTTFGSFYYTNYLFLLLVTAFLVVAVQPCMDIQPCEE